MMLFSYVSMQKYSGPVFNVSEAIVVYVDDSGFPHLNSHGVVGISLLFMMR